MLKNSYKFLFISTLILGTTISISSSSWFSIWMGLEINLLSFIPLSMKLNNSFSSEASLKYFLTQALASSILLFSIIFFSLYEWMIFINSMNYMNFIFFCSLMLKTGIAPFHFWFPNVMEGLSWKMNFILMSWQKIAPLMIISLTINFYFFFFIISSTMVGSLGGLNQSSLRKLMAYSSINHLAWMLASMMNNEIIWIFYFIFYSFISLTLILNFSNFSIFWINQIFLNLNMKKINKLIFCIPLLSLGGLPPFLGFFPKWLVIETLLVNNFLLILTLLMFFSLITLYYYIRISFSLLLMNHNKLNFKNFNYFLKNLKMNNNYSFNFKMNSILMMNFFSIFSLLIFNFIPN